MEEESPRGDISDESGFMGEGPVLHGAEGRGFQKARRRERSEDLKVANDTGGWK